MFTNLKDIRRPLVLFFLLVCALIPIAFFYIVQEIPTLGEEHSLRSNLVFFLLININVIVVMVLGFLVAKNLVKLVLDRRRGILGSRLRSRLVIAFVGLSLIPTVLLFVMAKGILERVLQEWFSPQIQAAVDGALGVAQFSFSSQEAQVYRFSKHLSGQMKELAPYLVSLGAEAVEEDNASLDVIRGYFDSKLDEYGVSQILLVDRFGKIISESLSIESQRGVVSLPGINLNSVKEAAEGSTLVFPEHSINGEFLRAYSPIVFSGLEAAGFEYRYVVVVTLWISPTLNEKLSEVITAFDDYRELRTYRRPLGSSYVLSLVIVTLLIIFSAIWVGFYLAKSLSIPIQKLAEGTQEVAHGNLEYRIPELGDDELSILVRSFNKMTQDLQQTNDELIARRNYMETVLASVGVGVVSVDTSAKVATINIAASEILGFRGQADVIGKSLEEVFNEPKLSAKILDMLQRLYSDQTVDLVDSFEIEVDGAPKQVQITINKLMSDGGQILGAVVLIDDLTELVSAQRMAAWREVARRIAHEIKNPLTPIQLSAQRIQRRFSNSSLKERGLALPADDSEMIAESTEMIVSQVEALRTLVNEFSRFARMPKANPKPMDINSLIVETVGLFKESQEVIDFDVSLDNTTPLIELDKEQIVRVLINLIDNAVSSVLAKSELINPQRRSTFEFTSVSHLLKKFRSGVEEYTPRIAISSKLSHDIGLISIEVSDNGLGVSDGDFSRIFEPYFSTKKDGKGGTGLGLAIVNTIVADHNGFVRVRNNNEGGATFIVELPVARAQMAI